ncbi:MAG: cobyric acid synthase, partial [Pararhizobium sp.]
EKTVRNTAARSAIHDIPVKGYEIHLGRTEGPDALRPSMIVDGRPEGAVSADGRVVGTYLHGLFSSDAFRRAYLRDFGVESAGGAYRGGVEAALDRIAEMLARHLEVERLFATAR